jgi:integrase
MAFAARTRRPPKTLTDAEQKKILRVTGEHREHFRDNVIISIALGLALRESEIVALDVVDVSNDGLRPKRTIQLRVFKRAGAGADPANQRLGMPDGTFYRLEKYLRTTKRPLRAPLFPSRQGDRLSVRRVRSMFRRWQKRAGFDNLYGFHHLRHTAISNLRRKTGDLLLCSRLARHANIETTRIYAHASDEEVLRAVKDLPS